MKLLADFHTHTKNSRFFHGKNSIEEMVHAANAIGLKELAITDHGYHHLFCTNKAKIIEARKAIDEINNWSKTKILLGVEADIIDESGNLDIDNETLTMIDILLVGYHKMIKTDFAGYFGSQSSDKEGKLATNAFINCLNKYPVSILVHPNSVLKTDLYEIGCACRDNGVLVEINNRHCDLTEQDIEDLIASECLFVCNSDAHRREDVGSVSNAFEIVKKFNIPSERVLNVEFEENEKSLIDRTFDPIYKNQTKKKDEKTRKERELEARKKLEFVDTLSDDMEKELLKIAREKGLDYDRKLNDNEDDGIVIDEDIENDPLVIEAKKKINELKAKEENKN